MILYRLSGVRSKTSPAEGPETVAADFAANGVQDAWAKVIDLLPCDGEWCCQLSKLWARSAVALKPRTFVRVTTAE